MAVTGGGATPGVRAAAGVCGAAMVLLGVWAVLGPGSFAAQINFPPYNEHLLHDVGAFQLGIGVSVLAALAWPDALTVALLGFLVAGTVHVVNHVVDLHLGGHAYDGWLLAALDVLALTALIVHLRRRQAAVVAEGSRP